MRQDYQKTANGLRELQLSHPGILSAKDFHEHFELHCYEPSSDLQPFVVHLWTQRVRGGDAPTHKPIEILSGPNMYLFFTADSAFVHGITPREFSYDPATSSVIAGVKFRPGGFSAFSDQPITSNMPLTAVFPQADRLFRRRLLAQSDQEIVTMLETLLRSKQPAYDRNLESIDRIMAAIDEDPSLQNVEQVAHAFDMSERALQLLFQRYVGVGLKWTLTRKRLLETVSRVQAHEYASWTEAAAELGYSSLSHFSQEFKQVTGLSPSHYLKVAG